MSVIRTTYTYLLKIGTTTFSRVGENALFAISLTLIKMKRNFVTYLMVFGDLMLRILNVLSCHLQSTGKYLKICIMWLHTTLLFASAGKFVLHIIALINTMINIYTIITSFFECVLESSQCGPLTLTIVHNAKNPLYP